MHVCMNECMSVYACKIHGLNPCSPVPVAGCLRWSQLVGEGRLEHPALFPNLMPMCCACSRMQPNRSCDRGRLVACFTCCDYTPTRSGCGAASKLGQGSRAFDRSMVAAASTQLFTTREVVVFPFWMVPLSLRCSLRWCGSPSRRTTWCHAE